MVFPFNRTELLRKRKDNSSVTRFACATFPTREGKAAAPRYVIANHYARRRVQSATAEGGS